MAAARLAHRLRDRRAPRTTRDDARARRSEPDPFEVPADERGEPSDSEEFGDEDGYDPDEDSGD